MNRRLLAVISIAAAIAAAAPVAAQTAPGTAGSNDVVPEKVGPPLEGKSAAGGNTLGNALSHSNGVITPPDVDPSMSKPAPATKTDGSVIPAPGSPGGSQSVQPK